MRDIACHVSRSVFTLFVALWCAASTGCARTLVRPVVSAPVPATEALLVLPGFGDSRAGADAMRAVAPALAADGIELFIPRFLDRGGLSDSRENLQRFIREHPLEQYQRVHVFAFIAGAWAINPLLDAGALPNLSTIVYDRSPMQERAARVASGRLRPFTWIRYGTPVFDVARTPYPPLTRSAVRVGLLVETRPTGFVKRHASAVRGYGPLRFECDALGQRYDDCAYLPLSHDQMYRQFAGVWREMRPFVLSGRFSDNAVRQPPDIDPLPR